MYDGAMSARGKHLLILLHRSYGAQDEFLRFTNDDWHGREAGSNVGPYQHIPTPQSQRIPPPHTSWNYDVGLSFGPTDDHLRQPTATYGFPHLAPSDLNGGSPSPTHLPNEVTQSQFSHSPGSVYQIPQQPTGHFHESLSYVLDRAPDFVSHIGLPQDQQGTLDSKEDFLVEDGDRVAKTDLPGRVSKNIATASDSSLSTTSSWMAYSSELQNELNAAGDVARQPWGSSTIGSPGELNTAISGSQSGTNSLEVPMVGSKRTGEPSPVALHRQFRNKFINEDRDGMDRLSPSDLNINGPQIEPVGSTLSPLSYRSTLAASVNNPKTVSKSVSRGPGESPYIPTARYKFESPSPGTCRRRFTPETFSVLSQMEMLGHAHIIRSATGFWLDYRERRILLGKSIIKWLPVYTANFKPEWQNNEMEAKLAILFEQLWLINAWLLYSFDVKNIREEIHHYGQDSMMTWVVNKLLGNLPVMAFPKQDLPEFDQLQKHITKYLSAPRVTKRIKTVARHGTCPNEVEIENILACETGVYILEAYYQTNNWERYQKALRSYEGIYGRLHAFTRGVDYGHLGKWKLTRKTLYGKVPMVPWSRKKTQQQVAHSTWDADLIEKMERIRLSRLQEVDDQTKDWIYFHTKPKGEKIKRE